MELPCLVILPIGFLLLITHLLASITVGFIFRFWKYNIKSEINSYNSYINSNENLTLSNLGGIIGNSITSSINTILLIGGFVVLFSVIISILKTSQLLDILANCIHPLFNLLHIPEKFSFGFISGIFELTNGLNIVCSIPEKKLSINIIIVSFTWIGWIFSFTSSMECYCQNRFIYKALYFRKIIACMYFCFLYLFVFTKFFFS